MEYLVILIGAIFVNNIVFAQFLGICPFLGVSKKLDTALGMGAAVTFVMVLAVLVPFGLQKGILDPKNLGYLQNVVFILVIAALVQMLESVLKKVSPALFQALGIYLPLITTNCAVLGVALLNVQESYNVLQGTVNGFATAVGFTLSIVLMASLREKIAISLFATIREQLAKTTLPKAMQGIPAALLVAGILSLAFMGFTGVV